MKKFMMILTLAVAYFAATATAGAIPPRMRTPLPLGPLAATGLEAGSDGSIAAPCISDSDDARIAARHQQC